MRKSLRSLGRYFLAGVLAILPVVITVAVCMWVAGILNGFIGPGTVIGNWIQGLGLRIIPVEAWSYVVGILLVLVGVFFLGVLVESGARNLLQKVLDAVLNRIPLIGSIYGTSKQLMGMFESKDAADLKGMKVVFCMFGKESGAGVLALLVSPEKYPIRGREHQIVIIPTAPVPIGGALFFMPVENIQRTEMSVDGLMSIYVSMGVTAAQFIPPTARATPKPAATS